MQKQIEKLLTSDITGADEEESRSKVRFMPFQHNIQCLRWCLGSVASKVEKVEFINLLIL